MCRIAVTFCYLVAFYITYSHRLLNCSRHPRAISKWSSWHVLHLLQQQNRQPYKIFRGCEKRQRTPAKFQSMVETFGIVCETYCVYYTVGNSYPTQHKKSEQYLTNQFGRLNVLQCRQVQSTPLFTYNLALSSVLLRANFQQKRTDQRVADCIICLYL